MNQGFRSPRRENLQEDGRYGSEFPASKAPPKSERKRSVDKENQPLVLQIIESEWTTLTMPANDELPEYILAMDFCFEEFGL